MPRRVHQRAGQSKVSRGFLWACSLDEATGMKRFCLRCMALGVAGAVSCTAPTAPGSPRPTVLVENPLCDSVGCQTVYIRAFVWAFPIPQGQYRGAKALGEIDGPTGCLQFPHTWTITVREVDSLGAPVGTDSTVFSWTPNHPDGIYLIARTSESFVGATQTFVPAHASGWNLTFSKNPGGEVPFTANLTAGQPCEPP